MQGGLIKFNRGTTSLTHAATNMFYPPGCPHTFTTSSSLHYKLNKMPRSTALFINFSFFCLFLTEVKNLICSLLNIVPTNRPTMKEALMHPWFTIQD